ncbi:ABC transporter ATP-binding protein [Ruegeria sp.]|uniref:ABC transporter ATP-binding protein n=1 Tax=Ruegeria sp. TaxID=1879320 RepID=UPI00230E6B3D|nr:ABC transporter ATP-binding protein [Ruegeria sp.]MDA7966482.1 ABC transporter ATP-binding protein [Ruegeria sp.]
MTLLETRALTKTFGGIKANTNVDFLLPEGQTMALIGPNGAGKSTFVGMLCGRIPATSGQVFFEGKDISALPAHKRIALGIAYTFQITSVFANLPVRENVALAVRRDGSRTEAQVMDRVDHVLDRVGLLDRADQVAGDLSYGHQRILEIAMGLGQDPKLFILDEPTQGLAESEVTEFVDLINDLKGSTTILLIEHNMDVVMRTAEAITVLNFGEILANGTPQQIQNNPAVQAAYLGTSHAED